MLILHFDKQQGRLVEAHGSQGATIVHLLRNVRSFVVTLYLEPDGVLGMHPAAANQLLLVVAGSGEARAGDQVTNLSVGTGVLWQQGEAHETRAGKDGLTAVVIEGDDLEAALAIN